MSTRWATRAPTARENGSALPVWTRVVAAVAVLEVVAGVVGFPLQLGGRGWLDVVLIAHVVAFGGAGVTLLQLGREDRRAVHLGVFYLLVASAFADPFARASAAAPALSLLAEPLLHVHTAALAPLLFWLFVRQFPRRAAHWERSRFADTGVAVALVVGIVLFVSNVALGLLPSDARLAASAGPWIDRADPGSLFWPALFVVGLPALPFAFWQARSARRDERRRAWLLLAGLTLGLLPDVAVTMAAAASGTFRAFATSPRGMAVVGAFVYPALLSIPVTTAYAVLVHRALDLRFIARRAVQYALARQTLLLAAAIPFAAGIWIVFTRRAQPVATLATGATGSALLVVILAGLGATRLRRTLLQTLDRRFFREQYDAERILANLVARIRTLRDVSELSALVTGEVDRALHVDSIELAFRDPMGETWSTASGGLRAAPAQPRFARQLESTGESLEVDWSRPAAWLTALPREEQQWLTDARARLLVPMLSRTGTVDGVMLIGEKRSELPFTQEDRVLLAAIAEAAALALETPHVAMPNIRAPAAAPADHAATPARECRACHAVAAGDAQSCERCGGELLQASLPELVAGKFRPTERIGSGGMGVVYRALDLSLERSVALKTLPRMAPAAAARLRREARSMAAVSHPNLAAIFAVESWHGSPILVVEYLPGGTLADRLEHGPLPPVHALDLCADILGALSRLHAAGILHRDVKPSNIGFAADGTPKLLDLGVAAASVRAGTAAANSPFTPEPVATTDGAIVGTLAYVPPEALDGRAAGPALDLWAIAMVLYEALAGRHPFAGAGGSALLARVATAAVPDVRQYAPGVPVSVAKLLERALARDRRRRPSTTIELLDELQQVRRAMAEVQPALVG